MQNRERQARQSQRSRKIQNREIRETCRKHRETVKWMDRGRAKGKIFPTIHGRGRKKSAAEMGSRWNRRRKKTDLQEVMMQKTYAIADVNSWLHVREGKGTNQKIVGILPKGSLCYILADADSDWVYVESGDVRGFVCARYLLRGEEAEKEVNRWQEESFPMAEMWVKPWNNKAYTYTYATTRTLLSSDEARGEVLQYAKKFLGNPYVWGGTSLTNGCDCSGFAQQIFANFGYTLPRTSRQQAKAGTRIPVQEAKPGDLLFYQRESGFIYHVMIYLGDGKVIHAGSEATGILISDFNYEKSTEFAVRVISEEIRESKIETGDVDNGRKEGNSVDNQTTENGNGGKQKAGAENVQNTSAEQYRR